MIDDCCVAPAAKFLCAVLLLLSSGRIRWSGGRKLCSYCAVILMGLSLLAVGHRFSRSRATVPLTPSQNGFAMVTGASSGVGKNIAEELARRGFNLILVARRKVLLREQAATIERKYGVRVVVKSADLTRSRNVKAVWDYARRQGGPIDVLVNAAGVPLPTGDFTNASPEAMERLISLNIAALTHLSRLIGGDMVHNRRGAILNVSSLYGLGPGSPNMAVYAASKAYVKSLSSALAYELEPHGVSVTCLAAGATRDTEFALNLGEDDERDLFIHNLPFGMSLTASEVARSAVDSLLQGQTLSIPGFMNRYAWFTLLVPFLPPQLSLLIGKLAVAPVSRVWHVIMS